MRYPASEKPEIIRLVEVSHLSVTAYAGEAWRIMPNTQPERVGCDVHR